MKNFVLSCFNVLAWIFEIVTALLAIILLVASFGSLSPHMQVNLAKGMGIQENISGNIFIIFLATFLVAVIFAAMCWATRSIRLVIRNLQHNIYFEQENLRLLHTSLKSLGVVVIIAIIEACVTSFASMQLKMTTVFNLNLSTAIYNLMILGIVYIIYLVFEKGIDLKKDNTK